MWLLFILLFPSFIIIMDYSSLVSVMFRVKTIKWKEMSIHLWGWSGADITLLEESSSNIEITVSYLMDSFLLVSWRERMSWETAWAWTKVLSCDSNSHCAERAPKINQEWVVINSQIYLAVQIHNLFSTIPTSKTTPKSKRALGGGYCIVVV